MMLMTRLPLHRSTINVIFLGICFAFIFTAYFTLANLEKILLSSLQKDDSTFTGDGYVSQGCIYATFSFFLWFGPSVNSVLGAKLTMFLGIIGYEIFICSFFFHITWFIYLGSALVGIGAALVWTGQGAYILQNSRHSTLERNLGLFQILFTSGSICGNIAIYFLFVGKKYIDESTRQAVIIFLSVILNIGGVLLLLLPRPFYEASNDKDEKKKDKKNENNNNNNNNNNNEIVKTENGLKEKVQEQHADALTQSTDGPWKTFKKAIQILFTKYFLILCFMFFNIGLSLAFTVIYNSCLGFTNNIPNAKEWVPLAGFVSGVGGIVGGILPIVINSEAKLPFKMRPLMVIGFFVYAGSYTIALLNFPTDAIFGDTDSVAFMYGNPYLCLFGTFLLHLGEVLYNTETQTLLAEIYSDDAVTAFSISFSLKNIFVSTAFYLSNYYGLHLQLIFLGVMNILGLISFAYISLKVHGKEKKVKEVEKDVETIHEISRF